MSSSKSKQEDVRQRMEALEFRLGKLERAIQRLAGPDDEASPAHDKTIPPPLPADKTAATGPTASLKTANTIPTESAKTSPAANGVRCDASTWEELTDLVAEAKADTKEVRKTSHLSLEKQIGEKWFLFVGLAVVLIGGVFFFKYAYDRRWINPPMRMIMGTLWAFGLICMGFLTLRREKMRLFSAGLFGAGVVWLYYTAWVASPSGWYYPTYKFLTTNQALAAMCAVTVVGVGLALRANMLSGAVIALIGAMATPVLLSSGENRQVELMCYLLAVDAAFLTLGLGKRWQALSPIALFGSLVIFGSWFAQFGAELLWKLTLLFSWAFIILFTIYVVVAHKLRRAHRYTGIAITALVNAGALVLWMAMLMPACRLLPCLAGLNILMLAIYWMLRGHWLRLGAMTFTALAMLTTFILGVLEGSGNIIEWLWLWCHWTWGIFAIFTIDIIVRGLREQKPPQIAETLDVVLSVFATAMMFAATFFLLDHEYSRWMGLYTLVVAAITFLLSLALRLRTGKTRLCLAYFIQGLILLTLAVPIQFDNAATTLVWAGLGLVMVLLAKWWQSGLLLLMPPVLLLLAVVHCFTWELPYDPAMKETLLATDGLIFSKGLLMVTSLSVGLLAVAIATSIGKAVFSEKTDGDIAYVLAAVGAIIFALRTATELPAVPATWCWLEAGAVLFAVGLTLRKDWSVGLTGLLLAAVAIKWMFYDTLHLLDSETKLARTLVVNAASLAGLTTAALMLLLPRLSRWRGLVFGHYLGVAMSLTAAVLVLWVGSFEISHGVHRYASSLDEPALALQMGLSVWWALGATAMLVLGIARQAPAARYFATVLYGVTIAKVFLMDMRGIDAVYRILSFLVTGVLLVLASWLYHQFFRSSSLEQETAQPD
ncbi:MAG: hypothetical protein DRP83_05140 [Planctomycetota bacterium]|nr:MAG: hypothetical protein DRP83_05140 [Planctomycetota bacterium]